MECSTSGLPGGIGVTVTFVVSLKFHERPLHSTVISAGVNAVTLPLIISIILLLNTTE